MKTITESIKSSLITEGKFPSIDIESFISLVKGKIDMDEYPDYGLDKVDDKYIDLILNHCKVIEKGGGYDGNGSSCYEYLSDLGFSMKGVKDEDDLTFDDGALLKQPWLREAGKIAKINAKIGSTYYTSGFESPTFVLFDVANAQTKDILNNIEGWY